MEQTPDSILLNNQQEIVQQDLGFLSENIKSKYTPDIVSKYVDNFKPVTPSKNVWADAIKQQDSKLKTESFSNIKQDEVYADLSDGSRVAKFDTIPSFLDSGSQIEEYKAQTQSTSDKWTNGLVKLLGKTGTAVLGGTIGSVDGIVEMAKTGAFQSTYDNKFNDWLSDLNTKMDYKLPNYYTQQEKDNNVLQSGLTANFWANDVLGGLSFTLGTIVSEGIWAYATGGASLGTTGARLGARLSSVGRLTGEVAEVAQATNRANALIKAPVLERYLTKTFSPELAVTLGKAGELLNTARFTYTSSGFESGQEASNYMKDARQSFPESFEAQNGRAPEVEDYKNFEKDLVESANGLFAFNMAIVGSSNLAIFGSTLGVSSPIKLPTKWANETFFGIGSRRTASGVLEELTPSRLQNIVAKSFSVLKVPLTEGVYEEGLQSVGQNTAKGWIKSTYDPKYTNDTMELGTAFTEGMAETFGSKEGWKEIGIGMIIGLLSGTGVNVARGRGLFGELNQARLENSESVRLDNEYSVEKTIDRIHTANRINSFTNENEVATAKGDYVGAETSRASALLAHITHAYNFGNTDQALKEFEVGINTLDADLLKQQYGFETEQEVEDFKQTMVTEYTDLTKEYKKQRDFVGFMINSKSEEFKGVRNIEEVKEAVAFELTLGKKSYDISGELLEELTLGIAGNYNSTGEDISSSLEIQDVLTSARKEIRQEFNTKQKELKKLKSQAVELEKQRLSLEKSKNSKEDNKADLNRLNKNVVDIQENLLRSQQLERELNGVIATAQLQNPYNDKSQIFVTSEQLTEIDTNLSAINELIKSYKETNPRDGYKLEKTLNEYKKSKVAFTRYADLSRQLSDPNLGLRGKRNIIKELGSDKTPTEVTLEFIKGISESMERISNERAEEAVISTSNELETMTIPEEEKKVSTVQDIIEDNPYLFEYVGTADNVNKPTNEEISEYKGLLNRIKRSRKIDNEKATRNASDYYAKKGIRIPLSKTEMSRFQELNQKISDWRLFEGALNAEGISMADLIEQELSRVEEEVPLGIKVEITNDDLSLVVSPEEIVPLKNGVEYRKSSIVQTYENVKVRVFDNFYEFSHLKARSILSKIPGDFEVIMKSPKTFDENGFVTEWNIPVFVNSEEFLQNENIYGTMFTINSIDGSLPITVANYGKLQIPISNFNEFKEVLGFDMFKQLVTNTSYSDLYELNEEGNYVQKESDFKLDQEEGIEVREYTPEEVLNTKPETRVFFKVNMRDSYNQDLKEEYEKGNIDLDYVISQVKVYNTSVNGKILGDLKSNRDIVDETTNFLEVRRMAASVLLDKNSIQDLITLPYTTKSKYVLLGTPNLTMIKSEDGVIPQSRLLTDRALEEVVDYGYTENGELKLNGDTKGIRTDFISKLSKKSNIPVIIFKQGEYLVAYPVTLNARENTNAQELNKILTSPRLNNSEKTTLINSILSENNIKPDLFYNTSDNQNLFNEEGLPTEKLNYYIDTLSNQIETVKVEDWLRKDYDKSNLLNDISITINLEERVLKSPKLIIDFENLEANNLNNSWYDNYISTGEISEEKVNEIANKVVESNISSEEGLRIEEVRSKLGHSENRKRFDEFIQLVKLAKSNISKEEIDILSKAITSDTVAVVGGTTDTKRNNIERADLDTAWVSNPSNLTGYEQQQYEIALSRLFLWIQSDNNTRQQPETADRTGAGGIEIKESSEPVYIGDIIKSILSDTTQSNLTSQERDVLNKEKVRVDEAINDIIRLNTQKQSEANSEKNKLC